MSKGLGRREYPKLLKTEKNKSSPGEYDVQQSLPNTFSNIQKKVSQEKKLRNKVKHTKSLIKNRQSDRKKKIKKRTFIPPPGYYYDPVKASTLNIKYKPLEF